MLKVGDTIYRFDINRRVYNKERTGSPIYREHFEPRQITGETKHSWLVAAGWKETKVGKKTMHEAARNGWGGYQWFTAEGMDDNIWQNEHRHKIKNAVDGADVATLRKVAEVLGYSVSA